MLFGSKETFAIEAMSEPHLQPPSSVWGRMRVWCKGSSLGDYAEECCGMPYKHFVKLHQMLPALWRPEFEGMADLDLLNHLDGLLYGYHGDVRIDSDDPTLKELRKNVDQYWDFNFLTNWGEQFDYTGKCFIFCTPSETVRVLNRSWPGEFSREMPLPEVLAAIEAYLDWSEAESLRLGTPVRTPWRSTKPRG